MEKSSIGSRRIPRVLSMTIGVVAFACLSATVAMAIAMNASTPGSGIITPISPPVTWTGTAIAGGFAGEEVEGIPCEEGVNCDTFTLNVSGSKADWNGKMIRIDIGWTLPVNDYDLYVHKDSNSGLLVGTSGAGVPAVTEATAIDPSRTGTGVYTVHVVYFAVVPMVDQYKGKASVVTRPANGTRSAIYMKGGMTFSDNWPLTAPVTASDGEPSSRCDSQGNYYVAGIRGVPAGVDLWHFDVNPLSPTFDPFLRNPSYRGQPDSFTQDEAYAVGADGGGDVDLAVGFGNGPGGVPTLAFTSLTAANVSSAVSNDLGKTWTLNPAGNVTGGIPADDRQWNEFVNDKSVYLLYRTLEPAVAMVQRSNDGGLTYGPAVVIGEIGQVGGIDVDRRDGTVLLAGSTGTIAVGTPTIPGGEPTSYALYEAASDPFGLDYLFLVPKIADDGTFYLVYSNGYDIYLKHSTDRGHTWSLPVRVNDGADTRCALQPAIETGPEPGTVYVAWYGTSETWNNTDANWKVFLAQTFNATNAMPTFRQGTVSDHYIHAGVISVGGLLGNENRNLLDYFQICFDPQGAALIAFTDDHNDLNGNCVVARQTSGMASNRKKMKKQIEGAALPEKQPLSSDGSHVVDFRNDQAIGLLVAAPQETAFDILSITYSTEVGSDGRNRLVAKVKVSDLSKRTPNMSWRVNFTANAPFTGLNPTGQYSNGLMDRGDKFYMRGAMSSDNVPIFRWGTVIRDRDGGFTYTERGTAEGSLDDATHTVTVKVPIDSLNAFVTRGPAITSGSVLCGLFGMAYTTNTSAGVSDLCRGGTEFVIP